MKLHSISGGVYDWRRLMPAYRLHETPMAWKCAVCGKLFSITAQEAVQSPARLPPLYLEREFRLHNCELQLFGCFSDIEIHDVENWT
jgi:hypothetical protein